MLQGEDEGDLALRIAQRRDRLARLRERLAEALQRDEVGDDVGLRGRRTRYVVARAVRDERLAGDAQRGKRVAPAPELGLGEAERNGRGELPMSRRRGEVERLGEARPRAGEIAGQVARGNERSLAGDL